MYLQDAYSNNPKIEIGPKLIEMKGHFFGTFASYQKYQKQYNLGNASI